MLAVHRLSTQACAIHRLGGRPASISIDTTIKSPICWGMDRTEYHRWAARTTEMCISSSVQAVFRSRRRSRPGPIVLIPDSVRDGLRQNLLSRNWETHGAYAAISINFA